MNSKPEPYIEALISLVALNLQREWRVNNWLSLLFPTLKNTVDRQWN